MINNCQLADAILARMPGGVTSFEIARHTSGPFAPYWRVTIHDEAMLACHECVSQTDPLLSSALAKANVSLLHKRAEIARRDGIALAYSADWSATSLQCEREARN